MKDEHNEARDRVSRTSSLSSCVLTVWQTIAKHVMNIHMNRQTDNEVEGEIDIEKMKRYISYAKS